jgi:hypothetical protein
MARPKDLGLEHTRRLRLRRQATGGLSIPELCERERVSTASFYAWRRRLAAPPVNAPSDAPWFIPIRLDTTAPAHDRAAGCRQPGWSSGRRAPAPPPGRTVRLPLRGVGRP